MITERDKLLKMARRAAEDRSTFPACREGKHQECTGAHYGTGCVVNSDLGHTRFVCDCICHRTVDMFAPVKSVQGKLL